ncbi:MAG: hypothetical protein LJE59_04045 [Chromatiaceae bacterium]|nr:hypothetical protein [Chromatiaceae bacterium]
MPINPDEYERNEAWLLFRLNDAPVRTEADGDFNGIAVTDAGTGLILGMEFVAAVAAEGMSNCAMDHVEKPLRGPILAAS